MIVELLSVVSIAVSIELFRLGLQSKRRLIYLKNFLLDNLNVRKPKKYPFFHICIPLYNETTTIEQTINCFSDLKYPKNRYTVTLVTTEKEGKNKGTTYELAKKLLSKRKKNNIKLLHYPKSEGKKAHQLNYFVKKLKQKGYLVVFDADSKPAKNTFWQAANLINKSKKPEILQQYALHLDNYETISSFGKAAALFQTRWVLTHELYNCIKVAHGEKKVIQYIVGHGLFFELSALKKIGLFPEETPIEDLALGYRASYAGYKILPIPSFDNCQIPENVKGLVLQNGVWYSANFGLGDNRTAAQRKLKKTIPRLPLATIIRKYEVLRWGIGSVVFILLLLFALLNKMFLIFGILIMAGTYFSISGILFIRENHELWSEMLGYKVRMSKNPSLFSILVRGLVISIGPIIWLVKEILRKTFNKDYEVYKTER